jgi:hypothetical protein
MRRMRIPSVALVVTAMILGSAVAAIGSSHDTQESFNQVTGTMTVGTTAPGGDWDVVDGVSHYRAYPISASGLTFSDPRLNGQLQSDWNWDVHGSGSKPTPSWGTMQIATDEVAWQGTFTGIKRVDGGPVDIRAFLVGEGLYDGFCATLDITTTGTATGDTWIFDGVIIPACGEA